MNVETTYLWVAILECEDLNAHCAMWEQLGHCEHSTKYMQHYCRKACKWCNDEGMWLLELKNFEINEISFQISKLMD